MKKLLKYFAFALLIVPCAFAFVGCGGGPTVDKLSAEEAREKFDALPMYEISYTINMDIPEYSRSMVLTFGKTADSVWIKTTADGETEGFGYKKVAENSYQPYKLSSESWVSFGLPVSHIDESALGEFSEYAFSMYEDNDFFDKLTKGSGKTVAGRACTEFKHSESLSAEGFTYNASVSYVIDNEYGICLEYLLKSSGEGQTASMTLKTTSFKTADVTAPF